MKYLRQFMIILAAYLIGQGLQIGFHLPVPGAVIGLILLFLALQTGIIKVEMIEEVCEFLLSNMSLLFIPAGVGLMTSFGVLQENWIAFLAIVMVSTVLIWLMAAYTVKLFRKKDANE